MSTFDQYLIIPYPGYENSYPPYSAGITSTHTLITQLTGDKNSLSKDVSYLAYNQLRLSYNINTIADAQKIKFTQISSSVAALDAKVAKMDPLVITQSISFLIGAFVAIAFIFAVRRSSL